MQLYLNNSGSRWTSTEKADREFILVDLQGNKTKKLASYFVAFGNFVAVGFTFRGQRYEGLPRNSERGECRITGELPHIFLDTAGKVPQRSSELTLENYFKLSRFAFLRKFEHFLSLKRNPETDELHGLKHSLLHNKDFLSTKALTPNIKMTFGIITEESAEQGDFARTGWEDKRGQDFPRSEEDYLEEAIRFLRNKGVCDASSFSFHLGIRYTTYLGQEVHSGEYREESLHLYGFTEEEEKRIYYTIFPNRK